MHSGLPHVSPVCMTLWYTVVPHRAGRSPWPSPHVSCLRDTSLRCATSQGDAFILAFHNPSDAVLFASDAQMQLQLAPWPVELHLLHVSLARDVSAFATYSLIEGVWMTPVNLLFAAAVVVVEQQTVDIH